MSLTRFIKFAAVLAVLMASSGFALAQSCSKPPTCKANQASSWNGSNWVCVDTGTTVAATTTTAFSGSLCGLAVVNSANGRSNGDEYIQYSVKSIAQCNGETIVNTSWWEETSPYNAPYVMSAVTGCPSGYSGTIFGTFITCVKN